MDNKVSQLGFWPELDARDPRVRVFWQFHKDNPHVYGLLKLHASKLKAVGHKRYGMKGLFEVLRWHHAMKSTEEFKLNNNYTAYYARLLMHNEPELKGFFVLRNACADREG